MAYSNIDKPNQYFNTVLYTGDGSASRDITGVGFQPDFTWIKERSGILSHVLGNSVSGDNKFLSTNGTSAESTDSSKFRTFVSDGFQVGSHPGVNGNTDTFVGWSWLGGGTASSNTDGSITSNVSANTTSGFSIVSYTGTGANATVGHGLGVAPKVVIVKNRTTGGYNWVFGSDLLTDWGYILKLNLTDAQSSTAGTQATFNSTAPTSSVFTVGTSVATNTSSDSIIAYCFAEKKGYSKFGSYTGNGSTDGTFVYTGFKPAFVLTKKTNATQSWAISDNKRTANYNDVDARLFADLSNAESTSEVCDFVSNGFKIRSTFSTTNASGDTYIYMAFAESPLVGSNLVPNNAR